ncbi:CAAX amino terminal protease self-immunity [Paraliobacillus sp. PM-2]|uniref:CPBP family intramembrane glutamic endopeptidase n=1 Tax=Paraliobacillus sp. PM-2 TaxID=1462524 RepID=UPI00061CB506|nr:type II CAAX endopeptidase family protein [Paraliobacillus sp. PM-2]CQR47436.1 CAAX amino terminal protease self-immunity [Paraliobacillus sp. PM-2]
MGKRYLYILLTYILMQLSSLPVAVIIKASNINEDYYSIIGTSWTIFSFIAALVIMLFLLRPERHLRKDRNAASPGMVIVWSIIGVLMAMLGQGIMNVIQTLLLGIEPGSENTQNIMAVARAIPIFIIVVAIIGPILEEIVFRKIIFGEIYKRTNFFIGAFASGLIFAVVHNDFQNTLIYLTIGFVFAFVYVQSKRIIVPIIAHATMNTAVVIAQLSISPEELNRMLEQYEKLQMILIGG